MLLLTHCPKCGATASDASDTCPRCGVIYAKATTASGLHLAVAATGRRPAQPNPLVLRYAIGGFLFGLVLTAPFFGISDPDRLLGPALATAVFTLGSVVLSVASCLLTVRLFFDPPRLAEHGPWPLRLASIVLFLALAAFSVAVVLLTLNVLFFRIH